MTHPQPKHPRVLAIAPSTRGFGFVVLEGEETLVDWGVKSASEDKNAQCLAKLKDMIVHYEPHLLVLQDHSRKDSQRSARVQTLGRKMIALASRNEIRVKLFSREEVRRFFFSDSLGTKYALAEILAKRFPAELAHRLPPKRRAWMSEDSRMDIFDAVSLALALRLSTAKRTV